MKKVMLEWRESTIMAINLAWTYFPSLSVNPRETSQYFSGTRIRKLSFWDLNYPTVFYIIVLTVEMAVEHPENICKNIIYEGNFINILI